MCPDDKDKKWGTIYLDAARESTMEKLDAMQAASRQEQWNQRTQQDYLEKVRSKATERAREILGEAYAERQKILHEAKEEANRIRLEAQVHQAVTEEVRQEVEELRSNVRDELIRAGAKFDAAQEEGFHSGLEQARDELEQFRASMGAAVAGVLGAVHVQCISIFEGWRHELVELLKVCVEKSTGHILDEQYALVMEHLVLEAVRQLDDRRNITLRVHPDDEQTVADMVTAARERLPNIGHWMVAGDPSIQLGGLIAESPSGTVDSRLELHRDLVENILQHLTLPGTALDAAALQSVEDAVRLEAQRVAAIAPPLPVREEEPIDLAGMEMEADAPALDLTGMEAHTESHADILPAADDGLPPPALPTLTDEALHLAAIGHEGDDAPRAVEEMTADALSHTDDNSMPGDLPPSPAPARPRSGPAAEPTRDELEEELFDLPSSTPMDTVLAQGGFLDSGDAKS